MKLAAVIVVFGTIAAVLPEAIEANALGRRVGSSVVRGGWGPSSGFGRRGRNGLNQEPPQDGLPQFFVSSNGLMNGGDDSNGDGIPDWCNWKTPMGAWLNYRNMKRWCARNGYAAEFGPYGGVPDQNGNQGMFPSASDNGNSFAPSDLSTVGVANGNRGPGLNGGLPATGSASNGGTITQYPNTNTGNGWALKGNGLGAEKRPGNGINGLGTTQHGLANGWGVAKQPSKVNGWGTNHQAVNGNNGNGWGTKYPAGNGNGLGPQQSQPGTNGNGWAVAIKQPWGTHGQAVNGNGGNGWGNNPPGLGSQHQQPANGNGLGAEPQPGKESNGQNGWTMNKHQQSNGNNGNAWGSTKYQPANGKGPNGQGTPWTSSRPMVYNQLHNGPQGQGSGRYGVKQNIASGTNGFNQGREKFGSNDYYNF